MIFDRIATSPEAVVSIDGIREASWATGHVVTICETLDNPEMERRAFDAVMHDETDLVIYATIMTRKVDVPRRLYAAKPPVVLLNCYCDDRAFPSVVPGEVAGGHRATEALIDAGHQRIAIITGELWMDAARDRLKGYRQALATADIPYDPALVREGNWQPSAGYDQTNALMDLPRPPTAIFCSNDRMAVGCYEALKERRLAIPGDVSVIGYDDEEVARHLSPQLTTLVLPHREMGRWAVERGFSLVATRREKYPITKLECPLIEARVDRRAEASGRHCRARAGRSRRRRQLETHGLSWRRSRMPIWSSAVTIASRWWRIRSKSTATMMKTPTKVPCQNGLMPRSVRLLRMISISAAPTTAPNAVPEPPIRFAPPMTTAAITISSIPLPMPVVIVPSQPT